jgi:hypothetical protein
MEEEVQVYSADKKAWLVPQVEIEALPGPTQESPFFKDNVLHLTLRVVNEVIVLNKHIDREEIITKNGRLYYSDGIIYRHDPESNQCVAQYFADGMGYEWAFNIFDKFYIIGDNLVRYGEYNDYAPNTCNPIFESGGMFFSVHQKSGYGKFLIVTSGDLKSWVPMGDEQRGPIVLFAREDRIFAIVESKVYKDEDYKISSKPRSEIIEIGNGENNPVPGLSSPLIFRPSNGVFGGNAEDCEIKAVYMMDNFLFVRTLRVVDEGSGDNEFLINIDNMSFTQRFVEKRYTLGLYYIELPVKQDDGWKLFQVMEDKTLVIDPFVPDAGNIKTLPALKELWYGGGENDVLAGTTWIITKSSNNFESILTFDKNTIEEVLIKDNKETSRMFYGYRIDNNNDIYIKNQVSYTLWNDNEYLGIATPENSMDRVGGNAADGIIGEWRQGDMLTKVTEDMLLYYHPQGRRREKISIDHEKKIIRYQKEILFAGYVPGGGMNHKPGSLIVYGMGRYSEIMEQRIPSESSRQKENP